MNVKEKKYENMLITGNLKTGRWKQKFYIDKKVEKWSRNELELQ